MIRVLGRNPIEVIQKILKAARQRSVISDQLVIRDIKKWGDR